MKRTEGLVKEGVASAQSLDDAKGRYDSARANLASLTKTYELARQGTRKGTDRWRARRSGAIQSGRGLCENDTRCDRNSSVPVDGTILERNVEQGEMVTTSFVGDRAPKSFVVTLADLNDIQVELDINQNDFNRIAFGSAVHGGDRRLSGSSVQMPSRRNRSRSESPEGDCSGESEVHSSPTNTFKPEMNARVTFLDNSNEESRKKLASAATLYVIPKRAVLDREER